MFLCQKLFWCFVPVVLKGCNENGEGGAQQHCVQKGRKEWEEKRKKERKAGKRRRKGERGRKRDGKMKTSKEIDLLFA